jgi:hypothetical protein
MQHLTIERPFALALSNKRWCRMDSVRKLIAEVIGTCEIMFQQREESNRFCQLYGTTQTHSTYGRWASCDRRKPTALSLQMVRGAPRYSVKDDGITQRLATPNSNRR